MKTKSYITFICLIAVLFTSCGKSKIGSIKVENFSNGKAAEVLVILDDKYWTEAQKNSIDSALTQPQLGLNQVEPLFDPLYLKNSDFTAHFQRHRNIVRFDVDPDYSSNTVSVEQNTFASSQVYAHFKGNNIDTLLALFDKNEQEILRKLYENDLKRVQLSASKQGNANLEKLVRDKFGVTLSIPDHYGIARQEDDFLWLSYRTARNDRFIVIYKTPAYTLNEENLIKVRDMMTEKYIPGAITGAYPIIAQKAGFPIVGNFTVGSRKGMEMRGLWESVNDNMGGPFYNFTFTDSGTGNAISIDGFVYAPEESKREYLREVEAIVKSVR
ncbi:DUF4837 family protein [Bacteroidales bacterium OttesenSCG-928-B11]|nr:DUF4837 family protein [Bacteroidales bacterium OttesenSCG-928-C03]MDL2312036.1 DUF4837 family protein [Bacteroidales bacterium OttesenSCG-928-B11]